MSSPREAELARKLKAREEELRHANAKIALLQQKIDLLARRIFGSKSEKLDPRQLELLLEENRELHYEFNDRLMRFAHLSPAAEAEAQAFLEQW